MIDHTNDYSVLRQVEIDSSFKSAADEVTRPAVEARNATPPQGDGMPQGTATEPSPHDIANQHQVSAGRQAALTNDQSMPGVQAVGNDMHANLNSITPQAGTGAPRHDELNGPTSGSLPSGTSHDDLNGPNRSTLTPSSPKPPDLGL